MVKKFAASLRYGRALLALSYTFGQTLSDGIDANREFNHGDGHA